MTTRRITMLATTSIVAVLLAGAVVGCGQGGDRSASKSASTAPSRAADRVAASSGDTKAAVAEVAPGTGGAPVASPGGIPAGSGGGVPTTGPKIVKTAELRLGVRRNGLSRAFDAAARVAARHGGFVADSSTAAGKGDAATGSLTIRVPAADFDAVRRELGGLGKVDRQHISGQDVGAQLVDFDARIRSQQAKEDALRTLIGRANTVGEVIQVQDQLFAVRQEIEQLQAQRTQLDDAASLATLRVELFEPGAPATTPEPEPARGFAHDLHRAWQGTVDVVGGGIIVVGYLLPLALLGLLVWGVTARLRRRPAAA